MEILNVITAEEVQAQRASWVATLNQHKTEIQEMTAKIDHAQKNSLALEGAIQAADIFLKIMNSKSELPVNN